jgi:lambda family phage portal protein
MATFVDRWRSWRRSRAEAAAGRSSAIARTGRRPLRQPRLASLSYDAASKGRLVANWGRPATGPNAENRAGAPLTRYGARDLERNNPHAVRILDVLAGDIIGAGVRPRVKILKRNPETGRMVRDAEKSDAVEQLFEAFMAEAVVDQDYDGFGLQYVAVRSMLRDGDSLIRRRLRRPSDSLPVPLQLEGLEADHLDDTRTAELPGGARVVTGVQFDPINRREGYWLFADHPGEGWPFNRGGFTSKFVPAAGVAHLFESSRLGQVRGVSTLHAVAVALRDLDDYHLAERTRKKGESSITAFVTVDDEDEESLNPQIDTDTDPETEDSRPYLAHDVYGLPAETASPGTVTFLRGSKSVVMNTPVPVAGIEEYERITLRAIAVGARLTYEMLSDDLSQVNWASYRAGLIAYRRIVTLIREHFVRPQLLEKVWSWFLDASIGAGLLADVPYPVEWSWPRFESVNRLDDAKADRAEMRNGTNSRRRIIAAGGLDPSELTDEIEEDEKDLRARGLVSEGHPSQDANQQPGEAAAEPTAGSKAG